MTLLGVLFGFATPAFGFAAPDFGLAPADLGFAAAGFALAPLGFFALARDECFGAERGRFGGGERRRDAISRRGAGN